MNITLVFLLCSVVSLFFLISIYIRKYSTLWVGFFFWATLSFLGLSFFYVYFSTNSFSNMPHILQLLSYIIMVLVLIIGFIVFVFGAYLITLFLFLNARSMRKKERHSLINSLPLLTAISLLLFIILSFVMRYVQVPSWVHILYNSVALVLLYFAIHILLFLTTNWLCNLSHPRKNQNYIIVLGSGLVNGKVSPLLAKRIDKAIHFYQKQAQKNTPPILLFSGGQGKDEPIAEAIAMKNYAIGKGVPEKYLLAETNSTNTLENMKFSKQILDELNPTQKYSCIYSTSNYHVLRSAIYARKAGLSIKGIGAKTALYYLPTALIREYIAHVWIYKKINIIIPVLLFGLNLFSIFFK